MILHSIAKSMQVIPVLIPIYKPDHRGLGMVIDSLVAQKKSIKFDMALYFIVDDLTSDIDHLLEPLRVFNVPYFVENNPVNKGQWSIYNNFSLNCGSKWFFILHQDDIVRDDWFLILTTELDNANPEKCATISSEWDRLPNNIFKKNTSIVSTKNSDFKFDVFKTDRLDNLFKSGCWWHMSGSLVSCFVLNQINGFDSKFRYYSDFDFLLKTFACGFEHRLNHNKLVFIYSVGENESSRCFDQFVDVFEDQDLCLKYRQNVSKSIYLSRIIKNFCTFSRRLGKNVIYWKIDPLSFIYLSFKFFRNSIYLLIRFF